MRTLLSCVICLLFFTQCRRDPCKDITCNNGGTCFEGICQCPEEISGSYCEFTEAQEPCSTLIECLEGSYLAYDQNCWPNGNDLYNVTISQATNDCLIVATFDTLYKNVININNIGNTNQNIYALLNGIQLTIPIQAIDVYSFQGNGTIDTSNTDTLKVSLNFKENNFPYCVAELNKID